MEKIVSVIKKIIDVVFFALVLYIKFLRFCFIQAKNIFSSGKQNLKEINDSFIFNTAITEAQKGFYTKAIVELEKIKPSSLIWNDAQNKKHEFEELREKEFEDLIEKAISSISKEEHESAFISMLNIPNYSPCYPKAQSLLSQCEDIVFSKRRLNKQHIVIEFINYELLKSLYVRNKFCNSIHGNLIKVNYNIYNMSRETNNFSIVNLQLKDSNGFTYKELNSHDYNMWRNENRIINRSDDIKPLTYTQDIAVFNVRSFEDDFYLCWDEVSIKLSKIYLDLSKYKRK